MFLQKNSGTLAASEEIFILRENLCIICELSFILSVKYRI